MDRCVWSRRTERTRSRPRPRRAPVAPSPSSPPSRHHSVLDFAMRALDSWLTSSPEGRRNPQEHTTPLVLFRLAWCLKAELRLFSYSFVPIRRPSPRVQTSDTTRAGRALGGMVTWDGAGGGGRVEG